MMEGSGDTGEEELRRLAELADSTMANEPTLSARDQARIASVGKFLDSIGQPGDSIERSDSIRQINLRLADGESPEVIIESFGGRDSLEKVIGERDLQTLISFQHQEEEE